MTDYPHDEEAIFNLARKLSPEDRSAYLKQVCGDKRSLQQRIEELLKAHEEDGFLELPTADLLPTLDQPVTEGPGTVIDCYKLLQKIGEGGFGIVFMAEQQSPVVRKVALKVIKPGMDSKAVVARFEAERQALALMDHPNIAHILDGGITESGRPYFVMELVKGVPITEYCDKNELSAEDRLCLFVDVCRAVQHAHQRGVIHRDLSSSNIMVTLHDGKPVVKVIDFGVSKAIHQRLTEKTLFTAYGQMIGKPQYMSPEQAEMSGLDVDTRSDVYSLGVLLYELLTGTTPLEAERLRAAGYAEMQKLIREEEPPKPSTRLSGTDEKLTVIAKHRSATPERLHRLVRGDLDWIVMRALEKDRSRRYESASDLQRDVERFLNREAVSACPPSAIYRTRKFIRRNRLAVVVAASISLTLIFGLLGTSGALMWAVREMRRAVRAEADAVAKADEAESERERAQNFADSLSRTLYAADMNNAMTAWERNDLRQMKKLLEKYARSPLRRWEWYHLNSLHDGAQAPPFATPLLSPLRLYASPNNGKAVATYSRGAMLSVIGADGARVLSVGELTPGRFNFSYAAFSPNAKMLAHPDDSFSRIIVRHTNSLDVKCEIPIPENGDTSGTHIATAAFSPDSRCLAIGVVNWGVAIYDLEAQRFGSRMDVPGMGTCEVIEYSSDGKYLAVSSEPITVWSVQDCTKVHELSGHVQEVTSIRFVCDDAWLISASRDRSMIVWDAKTGARIRTLDHFEAEVRRLAYDPTRQELAVGLRNRTLKIWSLPDFTEVEEIRGYNGLYALDFFPDGRLVYGALDGKIKVRKRGETGLLNRFASGGWVADLEFSNCGQYLACVVNPKEESNPERGKNVLRIFRVDQPEKTPIVIPPLPFEIHRIAATRGNNKNLLAVGAQGSSRAAVIDLDRVEIAFDSGPVDTVGVSAICFDRDGGSVLCGLEDGRILELQLEGPKARFKSYAGRHGARVAELATLQDGRCVSGAGDGALWIWRDGRTEREDLGVAAAWVRGLATHGNSFAFGLFGGLSEDGHRVFLVDSNGHRRGFYGHTFSLQALEIMEQGKTLVSVGGDKEIKFWSGDTLEQRMAIRESEIFQSFALSPDERIIAAGTREGTILLYRAPRE